MRTESKYAAAAVVAACTLGMVACLVHGSKKARAVSAAAGGPLGSLSLFHHRRSQLPANQYGVTYEIMKMEVRLPVTRDTRIQELLQGPIRNFNLSFNGERLNPNRTLAFYGIGPNSQLLAV